MTVEEILAALQAIIDGATDDEGNPRPLDDEEAARYQELEGQLERARRDSEIRARQQAYTTPVRRPRAPASAEEPSEELRALHHYALTGDASQIRAITTTVDSAGGYLVPDTTQAKIIERLKAFGGLQNEAEQITTDSGEKMLWATEDDTDNVGEIVAEGAAAAGGADKVFGQASLEVYKYEATGTGGLPMKVSWEFLQDSPINFENHIADNFARRIARKFAVDIATGDGTGEPLGIVTPQTAFAGIAANATGPDFGELVSAVAEIDPEYLSNAKWLMAPSTWWTMVTNLVDADGRPLLMASAQASVAEGVPFRLLGYPVVLDPGMPALGDTSKSIVFGDLRQSYIVRTVKGFTLLRLNELYAVNGFVGFLGWARMGGTVQNLNSYVVLAGENTA